MLGFLRIGLVLGLFGAVPARATDAPVIVIPGKAGVPVIINGYDASYTVVEGDTGLDRPGHMPATIVSGPLVIPRERYPGHYFPAVGRRPGYGRREIEPSPNRKRPPPAESFERFWGIESMPLPVDTEPQSRLGDINADVNVDPYGDDDGRDHRRDRRRRPLKRDGSNDFDHHDHADHHDHVDNRDHVEHHSRRSRVKHRNPRH